MKDLISVFLIAVSLSLIAGFGGATLHADERDSVEEATHSYIVEGRSIEDAIWAVQAVGGKITYELRIINGVAATLTKGQRSKLDGRDGVARIRSNGAVTTSGGYTAGSGRPNDQ